MQYRATILILAALSLPACGGDDVSGSGTDSSSGSSESSATASTTMTTTSASTTMTTTSASTTTTASTTVDPTTADSSESTVTESSSSASPESSGTTAEGSSSTDPSGSSSTTDTGASAGYCAAVCEEAVDCCGADQQCIAGIGEYPYTWSCDEGVCAYAGCSTDEECTFGGFFPSSICYDFGDASFCVNGCAEDQDCEDQFLFGWLCTGGDGEYCEAGPCVDDQDCPNGFCNDVTGECGYGCQSDDDCDNGVCDLESGFCICMDDEQCAKGTLCQGI